MHYSSIFLAFAWFLTCAHQFHLLLSFVDHTRRFISKFKKCLNDYWCICADVYKLSSAPSNVMEVLWILYALMLMMWGAHDVATKIHRGTLQAMCQFCPIITTFHTTIHNLIVRTPSHSNVWAHWTIGNSGALPKHVVKLTKCYRATKQSQRFYDNNFVATVGICWL